MSRPHQCDWTEAVLRAMPGTLQGMADQTGIPKSTIKRWVRQLRAVGWAHVGRWINTPFGPKYAIFQAAQGRDAKKPKDKSKKQIVDDSRAKARKDGRYDFYLARQRVQKRLKKITANGRQATPFDSLMHVMRPDDGRKKR